MQLQRRGKPTALEPAPSASGVRGGVKPYTVGGNHPRWAISTMAFGCVAFVLLILWWSTTPGGVEPLPPTRSPVSILQTLTTTSNKPLLTTRVPLRTMPLAEPTVAPVPVATRRRRQTSPPAAKSTPPKRELPPGDPYLHDRFLAARSADEDPPCVALVCHGRRVPPQWRDSWRNRPLRETGARREVNGLPEPHELDRTILTPFYTTCEGDAADFQRTANLSRGPACEMNLLSKTDALAEVRRATDDVLLEYVGPIRRQLARRANSAERVAQCLDPRFPARLPMMLVPYDPVQVSTSFTVAFRQKTAEQQRGRLYNNTEAGLARRHVVALAELDARRRARPDRMALPTEDLVLLPCYGSGDFVCETIRSMGMWEPDILQIVNGGLTAVRNLRRRQLEQATTAVVMSVVQNVSQESSARAAVSAAMSALRSEYEEGTDAFGRVGQDNTLGVELMDVGANVGVFTMHFWRRGYPVQAFEALPFNMQLLSVSMCVNGISNGTDPVAWPSNTTGSGSTTVLRSGPKSGPPLRVYHAALGTERKHCVLLSEDANFGDTTINCDPKIVNSTKEFPVSIYRKRGEVQMTPLDDVLEAEEDTSKLSSMIPSRVEAVRLVAEHLSKQEAIPESTAELETKIRAELERTGSSFLTRRDIVAKMDVEGHEVSVLKGATRLLKDPARRPLVWVSEVWKSLDFGAMAEIMTKENAYTGISTAFSNMVFTEDNRHEMVRSYNHARSGQDTVVWIASDWMSDVRSLVVDSKKFV